MLSENKIKSAFDWFKKKVVDLFSKKTPPPPKDMPKNKTMDILSVKDITDKMHFMNMYVIGYPDPLWKDELAYYDALPLFFPIDIVGPSHGNGAKIRGLNIHYLEPEPRKVLIQNIFEIVNNGMIRLGYNPDIDGYDKLAYAQLTKFIGKYINQIYLGVLGDSGTKKIRLCYRSYFLNRIPTKIKRIKTSEMLNAIDLIGPSFQKMSSSNVYKDINELYNKYKGSNWGSIY